MVAFLLSLVAFCSASAWFYLETRRDARRPDDSPYSAGAARLAASFLFLMLGAIALGDSLGEILPH